MSSLIAVCSPRRYLQPLWQTCVMSLVSPCGQVSTLLCRGNGMSLAVLGELQTVFALFLSLNRLIPAHLTQLRCSIHNGQYLRRPFESCCDLGHHVHWSHKPCEGNCIYICTALWSLLWDSHGGKPLLVCMYQLAATLYKTCYNSDHGQCASQPQCNSDFMEWMVLQCGRGV